MKIAKIHLTNFKRFTDLLIDNIPSTSKLVLLIGANGSGKSSLFDAFAFIDAAIKRDVAQDEEFWNYFKKKNGTPVSVTINNDKNSEYILTDKNFSKPRYRFNCFLWENEF